MIHGQDNSHEDLSQKQLKLPSEELCRRLSRAIQATIVRNSIEGLQLNLLVLFLNWNYYSCQFPFHPRLEEKSKPLLWYTNLGGLRLGMTMGVVERMDLEKKFFVYYREVQSRDAIIQIQYRCNISKSSVGR